MSNQAINTMNISLAGKWAPSENSKKYPGLAKKIMKKMSLSPKAYRKMLVSLRQKIDIAETHMCARKWTNIKYSQVPSVAMNNYKKAFRRQDETRFSQYIENVTNGSEKINASVLYPHEIVGKIIYNHLYIDATDQKIIESQWKALPNYMEGNSRRLLPMVDVSGSMSGLPMEVAISLGMYIAERNDGVFKDCYLTFSQTPILQYICGNNLVERVRMMQNTNVGYSTNIYAAFKVILDSAINLKLHESEMPNSIIIFSDMQFNDSQVSGSSKAMFDKIKDMYNDAGYVMPDLTFWNLNAALTNVPVTQNEQGVSLVSGFSPTILKNILGAKEFSPNFIMRSIIDAERYSKVIV